ncbi:MAG: Uma2 family endonuclease [Methylomonas sp.]|nr:Uma2 family endonuclease [Methylomonas sp.]
MRWSDVLNDPSLRNLPYKIELDEHGRILMSPASNRHGIQQAKLVRLLAQMLHDGEIATECSIGTHLGVRVADVVWMSSAFLVKYGELTPYPQAPELCIEILSPSNSPREMEEKIRLYLGYGAHEVWIVDVEGTITLYGPEGKREQSVIAGVGIPAGL